MSQGTVYLVYALASVFEIYLFLMQRATLDVSRASNIDPKLGRQMLPLWYAIVWPNKLLRWVFLFLIWQAEGWVALLVRSGANSLRITRPGLGARAARGGRWAR